MPKKLSTIFQKLDSAFSGDWTNGLQQSHTNTYNLSNPNTILYKTKDKEDYESTKLELQQNRYLKDRWIKASADMSVTAFAGLSNVKLMYRDADLMDAFPEIGAALDIVAEEACICNDMGKVINVYSDSDRVKSILEDLFVNRLNIQIMAPMVVRAMCKYGNQFMLLDVDSENGVKGWKQLPVFEMERVENGVINPYSSGGISLAVGTENVDDVDMSTKFLWLGETQNSQVPFRNWQIAHFRLLTNSMYLPYGVSYLNSARRHWRMLSLMEDMMLIYRLERSVERRVYKIFVGAIDDADVQAYVEEIANNFKRTPIIDPMTGQVDLRKNILGIDNDIFIPVRDQNAPNPIDTLSAGQNLTAMDDIKFVQKKVCAALRMPLSFLNFEEAQGDGQNLALQDVRFTRTINRVQQAFLMELTKVADIHLYLLGFKDELSNFTLTMNNPSTQAEQLQTENLSKKIAACRDAVSDPGNGLPIMSQSRALRQIMHWSDNEIKQNLEEIRLEKAIAQELQNTAQIIQRTGIFDNVDRIYGEPGAQYQQNAAPQGEDQGMGGFGGGGGGGFGGGLDDIGSPMGGPEEGEIGGAEGAEPTADMGAGGGPGGEPGGGAEPPIPEPPAAGPENSSLRRVGNVLTEDLSNSRIDKLFEKYMSKIDGKRGAGAIVEKVKVYDMANRVNEEFENMIKEIGKTEKSSKKKNTKKGNKKS